jgi:putative addiction module component (TIGR02574 family)
MMDIAVVEANAMQLRESDRALLADRLLDSITPLSLGIRQAWDDEISSRLSAYRAGEIQAVEGNAAMDVLLKRFSK